MNQRWTVFVLLTLVVIPSACNQPSSSVGKKPQYSGGLADPAALSDVRESPPPKILPQTHFAAGQLLEAQGQFDQALAQYQRALLLNHRHVAAYHRLGALLARMGRHREAIDALTKALDLRPDAFVLCNNLGFEYAVLQEWDAAEAHLRRAIELNPTFERARINLGMVLCRNDRYDEAFEQFRTVLSEAETQYNLGLMYAGAKRYRDAGLAYHRALALDPNLLAAQTQLAYIEKYTVEPPLDAASGPSDATDISVAALTGAAEDAAFEMTEPDEDCEEPASGINAGASLLKPESFQSGNAATPEPAEAAWDPWHLELANPFELPREWGPVSPGASAAPSVGDRWVMEFIRTSVLPSRDEALDAADGASPGLDAGVSVQIESLPTQEDQEIESSSEAEAPCDEDVLADAAILDATATEVDPECGDTLFEMQEIMIATAADGAEPAETESVPVDPAILEQALLDLYIDDCVAFERELDAGLNFADGWNADSPSPVFAAAAEPTLPASPVVFPVALTGEEAFFDEPAPRYDPELLPLDPTWMETMQSWRTPWSSRRAQVEVSTQAAPQPVVPGPVSSAIPFRTERLARIETPAPMP